MREKEKGDRKRRGRGGEGDGKKSREGKTESRMEVYIQCICTHIYTCTCVHVYTCRYKLKRHKASRKCTLNSISILITATVDMHTYSSNMCVQCISIVSFLLSQSGGSSDTGTGYTCSGHWWEKVLIAGTPPPTQPQPHTSRAQ